MKKCILVKSVTYAQKAKQLLLRKGVSAYISKQNFDRKYGCAWCVSVSEKDLNRSLSIMEINDIKMNGAVYDI